MLEPSIYKPNEKLIGDIPPPPPLPKYDPQEEAPMWTWRRLKWNLPVEKPKSWTRTGDRPESDDDPDWRGVIRSKVIEYPMPEPYNLANFTDKPAYFFFDTPDYADPFKKLFFSAKYFLRVGLFVGGADMLRRGDELTLSSCLRTLSKLTVPIWLAGMASSAAIVTVANARGKKDDYWNYVAGGSAAAMVFGRKCTLHWIQSMFLCIPAALIVKHAMETNNSLWPQANFHKKSLGLSGYNNENGFLSGDLRFGHRARNYGDPGRDVRKTW